MITPGKAFVVCGPTAVGKGTVLKEVLARDPHLWYSVSATTRSPRPGEVDGVHYFFVSQAKFDELVAQNGMLEWAVVHKVHRYGTPRKPVEDAMAQGYNVILELDLDGARQVREAMPDARQIFIAPPSWDELQERLRGRGTEDEEEQQRRLTTARTELAAQDEFDDVVINDTVANATTALLNIIHSSTVE
ncbi:guanylate kinase [Arcanobacterium pinnipediorum]|uniref:Guanylate kinase n=1 Tax=Arcanobacterium pinnipediorum TaxID=1503041 RepID=A0ABY5AJ10_9ACTO|nr:guanylate kinase [Arcanobacterium pinnipediorum]USR80192.1 guanylate kinase [Arcanobacterium pinnipediorum]